MLEEVPDYRHGLFRCIGDHRVSAIRKSFELHEMRRQRGCDIRLAFDRVDRIVFAAEHEDRTPDAIKIREHVEAVAFAARLYEPLQHL